MYCTYILLPLLGWSVEEATAESELVLCSCNGGSHLFLMCTMLLLFTSFNKKKKKLVLLSCLLQFVSDIIGCPKMNEYRREGERVEQPLVTVSGSTVGDCVSACYTVTDSKDVKKTSDPKQL